MASFAAERPTETASPEQWGRGALDLGTQVGFTTTVARELPWLRASELGDVLVAVVNHIAAEGPNMEAAAAIDMALRLVADGPAANPTIARYSGLWVAFRRFCHQVGVETVADMTPAVAERWVNTLTRRGRPPSAATKRLRRTAIRHLFTVLRSVGITLVDPTIDLRLPPKDSLDARALTPDEITQVRAASLRTLVETRLPAILALAEAGATTSEIPQVVPSDLELDLGKTWLRGHTKTDARWATLSGWGRVQLARRVRSLDQDAATVTYSGSGPIESAQASTSAALNSILVRSIGRGPGIEIKSFRVTYGLEIYERTGRIEDAARALGMRSLDETAKVLGIAWRGDRS